MARRHRSGVPVEAAASSDDDDDDEDVFAVLSRKKRKKSKAEIGPSAETPSSGTILADAAAASNEASAADVAADAATGNNRTSDASSNPNNSNNNDDGDDGNSDNPKNKKVLPAAMTSSNKRHHGAMSDSRKAKMDALIMELEAEKRRKLLRNRDGGNSNTDAAYGKNRPSADPPYAPDKRGSFVEPGQEHLTTNLFVGNLAPSITEEEVVELFRQFGDLYSVKIMWPRTPEERARNRHSGFVCFCHRQDAEDAMAACDETDPFNVGRRIMIRWGKNVKNANIDGTTIVIQKKKRTQQPTMTTAESSERSTATKNAAPESSTTSSVSQEPQNADASASAKSNNNVNANMDINALSDEQKETAIQVVVPSDTYRTQLISIVASFVAKDGVLLEQALLGREATNPVFDFLKCSSANPEHIYYKWRVFSFAQGDTFYSWRTEPFYMMQNGRVWIPPPLDTEAARLEEEAERAKEESILRQKQERRYRNARRDYMTGQQLEQVKRGGPDGGARLDPSDMQELDRLLRKQLCASRGSICEAMAFCFEKSGAAKQISSLLEELLVDSSAHLTVETRIARLYLLSDILFNSQQPGVKNAFLYRDAIERMTPRVFESLGKHGNGQLGRMTMNKLISAVRTVLNAWADWNVFNQVFLDELFARFEGREIPDSSTKETDKQDEEKPDDEEKLEEEDDALKIRESAQGTWLAVSLEDEQAKVQEQARKNESTDNATTNEIASGEQGNGANGESPDGNQIENDDADGAPLDDGDDDADGVPLDEEEEEEDPDGVPLGDDEDPDGVPLEEGDDDADGASLDGEDVDGADVDGEPI